MRIDGRRRNGRAAREFGDDGVLQYRAYLAGRGETHRVHPVSGMELFFLFGLNQQTGGAIGDIQLARTKAVILNCTLHANLALPVVAARKAQQAGDRVDRERLRRVAMVQNFHLIQGGHE